MKLLAQQRLASAEGNETVEGDGTAEGGDAMRKSLSDLREVLRYMKREREVLEAKLTLSTAASQRLEGTVADLSRQLDEVKSELAVSRKDASSSPTAPPRSEEEFSNIMVGVTQLNVVRESNAHLRNENEELLKKMSSITVELQAAKSASVPLEQKIGTLEKSVSQLQAENGILSADASYWKERIHQLVSRYNEIG